jgi:hypothetical protein
MAIVGRTSGLPLRSKLESGQEVPRRDSDLAKTKSTRPNINDDFVIPHIGPEISEGDIISFAEELAENIVFQPKMAVEAQANQDRLKVADLMG